MQLVSQMKRLGMDDYADGIIARIDRKSGSFGSNLSNLLSFYQAQGKTEEANRTALAMLRRTSSSLLPNQIFKSGNRRSSMNSSSEERRAALVHLANSGVLKTMIKPLEEKHLKSPNSLPPLMELIEYSVATKSKQAEEHLVKAIAMHPQMDSLRELLAGVLSENGKKSEACDQYLVLLKKDPHGLSDNYYKIKQTFDEAKRTKDLAAVIEQMDEKDFSKNSRLQWIVVSLISNDQDLAEQLISSIEKLVANKSVYQSTLVLSIHKSDRLLRNDRIYRLLKKMTLPNWTSSRSGSTWEGLDVRASDDRNGQLVLALSPLLASVQLDPSRRLDLQTTIENKIQQFPRWLAGRAILGLLDLQMDKKKEGLSKLQALFEDPRSAQSANSCACWYIAQQLSPIADARDLEIRLLKLADEKREQEDNYIENVAFIPMSRLVNVVGKEPEQRQEMKKRIDRLLSKVKKQVSLYGDLDYANYHRSNNTLEISRWLLSLEYPIDAYLEVKSLIDDPNMGKTLGGYIQENSGEQATQILLDSAKKQIDDQSLTRSLDRLIPLSESIDLGIHHAMVKPEELNARAIHSNLIEMLEIFAASESLAKTIDSRIKELVDANPSDLSAIVLQASWMIERDCAPETLVPVLRKLLDLAVMETSPENRRASFAEQRQAKQVASLWLVARGILDPKSDASKGRMVTNHNQCQSLASQLAERAIEASYRQKDLAARFSVAWELVNLQAKNQQDELCRKSLNQFIDAICGGKKSMASPREINSDLTPPLSISEFRIVMAACEIAESRGYLEIASKAVNRSLQGGLPVSDPIDPQVNQFQGSASWRGRGDPTKNDGIEIEVQNALKSVLVKLTNRSDLPAELYHALRLVVLPSSQPDDVRLFINSKELENGQQDSLGSALVRVGVSTGQLHQLKTDLENRGATPNSVAPKNALLFLIAVESGDLVGAKEILQQSIPQTDDRKTSQFQDAYALMALRAFDIPELRIDSIPFLKRWVKNRLSKDIPGGDRYNYDSANASILPDYIKKLSRILIDQGEQNAVEDFLQTVLSTNAKRQMEYGSGSYALMQKRKDMAKLPNDCVEVGLDEYAIDLLGRFADLPKSQYDSNWDQVPSPLAYAILKYRHLSPEQRYKLWYDWTMPTADRNTIRMVLCNLNFRTLPEAIISGNQRARQFGTTQLPPGVYSNLSELVLAASETNNLDSLGDQVRGMDQESSESTRVLLDLIAIQKKDPEQVDKLVSERINRSSATSDPESQSYEEVYKESRVRTINSLIAGFLKDRGLMSEFQDLLRVSEFNYAVVPNLGRDNQHWIYEDDRPWAPERGDASYQAWLNFPLQGDFTVSWDCPGLTTEVEFGGARLDFNGIALEDSTGAMHLSNTIWTTVRNPRIELRVQANEIDFRYNGKSISKQPTWGTSPWLGLVTRSNSHQWRNLKIEGNPTIPSEVSLISEESMDGWSSKPFNEPQWSPRLDASEIKDQQSKGQSIDKNLFVWKVQQGQIEATASLDRTEMTMESWLVYQRPMAPGESLRYEYFADAGRSVAHPTFGNTAMMLTPQGLKLHCITAKLPVRLYGLQTDNMIDVPQGQQKVKQLPIKEGQWNQVALDHRGNHIDLSINGYAVYSLPIEPGTEHRFGLFRFRNQGCLVRNAVLTGPWPKVVSDNLIADINANNPAYRADSSDLEKVIPSVFPSDWHQVIQAGGPETFQSLLDMVLPSQATSPRMPFVLNEDKSDPTRLRNPMVMDCLPVELVKTAHRQGKVDALRLAIDQFESRNPRAKIRVDALRALVQLESGDETAAIEALMKLAKVFKYAEEKNLNALDRTAILIVAKHAASKLDYQMISKYLMLKLIELPESQDQSSNAAKLPELLYQDFLLEEELQSMQKSAWVRSQWTTIPPGSHHPRDLVASDTRASTWLVAPGKATHIGGFDKSILIFQSPLVGNFEIRAKRTFVGDQDMNIDYGLHRTVGDSVEDSSELPDEQVANLANGEVARYQLIASDNTMTVHQNSAKIDGYSITNTSTPWLTLSAEKQECYGYIENLEILGSPTIPEEINISNTIGFEGWDGSLTGTAISSTGATDWSFQSDEIQSEFRKDYQFYPKYQDRYIRYLRPMLEDGVVEYEFYCSADTMVHPAIGSYAFLLLPDGIQVHRIAQIAEDQSTLLLVNTEPLDPPSKPIHFNMNQYNRAKLELKGDDLSIWVNGELVTTVVVSEPPSKRRIGLLAGTEKSAKVRNMKYRGDWPKQLPPVHQQVLAKP
jgi:hypothetical protein